MTERNSVIAPVEAEWRALNETVDSLGPGGLTISGADGWAVKDHLIHIAAWEISLIALLEGEDRAAAMGVPGLMETDAINAAIWSAHKDDTPEEVRAYSHKTHARLLSVLGKLSDADLQLSYNHYQPNDAKELPAGERPVVDWVAGNTYDHYAEHIGWINQLTAKSAAR